MSKGDLAGSYVVFVGDKRVGEGPLLAAARVAKKHFDEGAEAPILFFDEGDGRSFDVDLSGTDEAVAARLLQHPVVGALGEPPRGRGRPRLGVVCREVSLLPRHWSWLSAQPHGASASLRRLVDAARKAQGGDEAALRAIDAAHAFMWTMAGDRPGFEEASRALFRREFAALEQLIAEWPIGIRRQIAKFLARMPSTRTSAAKGTQ